jgi:hypothetical protein
MISRQCEPVTSPSQQKLIRIAHLEQIKEEKNRNWFHREQAREREFGYRSGEEHTMWPDETTKPHFSLRRIWRTWAGGIPPPRKLMIALASSEASDESRVGEREGAEEENRDGKLEGGKVGWKDVG